MKKFLSKSIITGAIALLTGFGSVFGTQGIIKAINQGNQDYEDTSPTNIEKSHQQILLDNLLTLGSFNVSGAIEFILPDKTQIDLNMNVVGDISDINSIKLKGDVNLYLNGINITTNMSYFKDDPQQSDEGTIYFSYKENNFYLNTNHLLDFIDMLPTEYGIELNIPEEISNLDLNTISEKIEGMEEKQSTNGDIYFVLGLSEEINLYVKTDAEYNFKGIRTDTIFYKGNEIHLDFDLRKIDDVILEAPNKENYQNFKPIFNIFKSIYNFLNTKQNSILINANISKLNDDQTLNSLIADATLNFGYDIENKSYQIDADLFENDRHHKIGLLFEDETAYLDIRSTKLSIKFSSIADTIAYIVKQLNFDATESLMDYIVSFLNDEKFESLRNGLSDLIDKINLEETSLSIDINTDAIGLDMGIITPQITFENGHLKAISIYGLKIKNVLVNLDVSFESYVHKEIIKESYVEFEPALTIVEAVMPLLKQENFRIEFNGKVESTEDNVKDVLIDGGLQFNVSENGFGYGKATIIDRDSYKHEIKADMKTKDEFLFSYNDTLNGKFSSKTIKELYGLLTEIITNPDDHFIELFGEFIEAFKNTPVGKLLEGDYLALLDTQLINSIEIDDKHMAMNISLGIIGMDEKSCDFEVYYHRDNEKDKAYLDGIKLSNLLIGTNKITFTANLKDFDQSKESERLDPYEQYLDFSDIKVLLQLGVNTSKFDYFHFTAKFNFSLTLIVDIEREIDLDIKIRNNKGKVQVAIEVKNIPIIDLKLINFNGNPDYIGTDGRNASIYFNKDIFYIKRVDDVHTFLSINKYRVTYGATYTTDYFIKNIAQIMLGDVLGVQQNWVNKIIENSSTESEAKQIEYEKILKDFRYNPNNGTFIFKIDLYSLTHVSVLKTADMVVYEDKSTEQLVGIDLDLTIHLAINIDISLKLTTISKEQLDDTNILTTMNSWVASRVDSKQNVFEEISKVKR